MHLPLLISRCLAWEDKEQGTRNGTDLGSGLASPSIQPTWSSRGVGDGVVWRDLCNHEGRRVVIRGR